MNPPSTTLVLGYHGCDRSVAERIFAGKASPAASQNDYDWLGHGIYFWEHNAQRAYEFAREIRQRPRHAAQKISRPAVVGAIIDLALCLNLLDSRYLSLVTSAYEDLAAFQEDAGEPMPTNSGGADRLARRLDCAVIETLHATRQEQSKPPFDTVRAAFIEGDPIYDGAGFRSKNHIQLCVRNLACIKGYFRPIGEDGKPLVFE